MRRIFLAAVVSVILAGCAPKMGEDIAIEPAGNLRFESSKAQIVMGMLNIAGISNSTQSLRIGTDVTVINRWHSDFHLKSLNYRLVQGKDELARGLAPIKSNETILIASQTQKKLPLSMTFDLRQLSSEHVLGLMSGKTPIKVEGTAVIKVWGIEKEYPFSKDVTAIVKKALS